MVHDLIVGAPSSLRASGRSMPRARTVCRSHQGGEIKGCLGVRRASKTPLDGELKRGEVMGRGRLILRLDYCYS